MKLACLKLHQFLRRRIGASALEYTILAGVIGIGLYGVLLLFGDLGWSGVSDDVNAVYVN